MSANRPGSRLHRQYRSGKVSTKFEDWIERNLLGMNTMDLKQVDIQDYAIVPPSGLHDYPKHEGEYLLDYDFNGDAAWKLSKTCVSMRPRRPWFRRNLARTKNRHQEARRLEDRRSTT